MQRYYSATTGGFYLEGINDAIPGDAVPIDEETFVGLMEAQSTGLEIRAGEDGLPLAAARELTAEELLAQIRRKRDALLKASDFTQLPDSPLTDDARTAWAAYREALRNLAETCTADPAAVVWPEEPA